MFTGILYTHIFYALGGSEMPNGQNLRPIAVLPLRLHVLYIWIELPTFLGLFIGTTFARAP